MTCKCIAEMDAKLFPSNARLAVTFGMARDGSSMFTLPTIMTEKIETRKRGSTPLAIPSFCPFCGVPYAQEAAA